MTSAALGLALLLVPVIMLGVGGPEGYSPSPEIDAPGASLLQDMDVYLTEHLPARQVLAGWNLSIRALGGQREYKQIFISGEELIPILDPPVDSFVRENTAAILRCAEVVGIPTYCVIIPTASAIRQESLPPFARTQVVNQKQIIEDVYSQMIGRVTITDAYTTLFNVRDQYLYYRTEDNLTALGGYHLYTALGSKLLEGSQSPSMSDYDIEYVKSDFYGRLYDQSPFKDARADSIAVYRYTRNPREYLVTKGQNGENKTYHTLYPLHLLELERPMDVYLGGVTAMTRIQTNAPYQTSLLVFGDKTALSYLPFLANHYGSITLVDLFQLDTSGYQQLDLRDYDQVLFAYGIESYIHTNIPSRAGRLLDALEEDIR